MLWVLSKKRLNEMLLMSTYNNWFYGEIRKNITIFGLKSILARAMGTFSCLHYTICPFITLLLVPKQ